MNKTGVGEAREWDELRKTPGRREWEKLREAYSQKKKQPEILDQATSQNGKRDARSRPQPAAIDQLTPTQPHLQAGGMGETPSLEDELQQEYDTDDDWKSCHSDTLEN